jgi:alpha-glucosidase
MRHLHELPHHDGSVTYVPMQEPRLGDVVPVLVRVPTSFGAQGVWLRSVRDGEPLIAEARVDRRDAHAVWWRADLLVGNPTTSYRFLVQSSDGTIGWLNGTGLHARDVTDACDFRVIADPTSPDWPADSVVYQVFPDRFARSAAYDTRDTPDWAVRCRWDDDVEHQGPLVQRQWFGGDLPGIAEHLDHLAALSADVLYLTPIWPGASNHRYDARTFDHVDPVLGGDAGLELLTRAAHERGIRVLGDLTTNHVGATHEWFIAARADAGSVEASYFHFAEHPDEYTSWLDVPTLPKLDHRNPALRQRLYGSPQSIVARWLRPPYSLDGWRIDVANMTGRHADVDLAHEVARTVRTTMSEAAPRAWLLAEHGHDASGDLMGHGWDGTMAYAAFTRPVWTWLNTPGHGRTYLGVPIEVPTLGGEATAATMREFTASAPWRARERSVNQLGSHDTPRVRTVLGREKQLVAAAMLATTPGVPMVFAGDEIGLEALDGEHARTPFPWQRRERWDATTFAAYQRLLALRRTHVALRRGGLRWLSITADALTFVRDHAQGSVVVHVARADHEPVSVPLSAIGVERPDSVHPLYGEPIVSQDGQATFPALGPAAHVYLVG